MKSLNLLSQQRQKAPSLVCVHSHERSYPPVWTEQEMDEFCRIEMILQHAELEFGASDEGDPWCALCDAITGAVLAHFARIDGTYVGDWAGLRRARRTDQLREALEQFRKSAVNMIR
jgi:hypothetical protein